MRSKYEIKLSKNQTLPIDGFMENGTNSNVLVIGSSGTGKTTSVVLPMLLDSFDKEPITFVVQDCKGMLYKNLSNKFINEGYDVKLLDFTNPKKSNAFNPFSYIETLDDARQIMFPLVRTQVRSEKDPFWELAAEDLLSSLAMYLKMEFNEIICCLPALSSMLNGFGNDYNIVRNTKLMSNLVEYKVNRFGKPLDCKYEEGKTKTLFYNKIKRLRLTSNEDYLMNLESYFSYPEGTFNSIFAVAKAALSPFTGKEIMGIFGKKDEMKLEKLANKKTIIFVNPSDVSRVYDPAVSLFYTLCLQCAIKTADSSKEGRLKYPLRLIIDDFASGAKIQDFDKAISNIRSRNISCTILMQSTSQLETLYSKSQAQTLAANCSTHLYLGSNDFDQEMDISKRINVSYDKVHELKRNKMIILSENKKPIIDEKYCFKEHPNYKLFGVYEKQQQKELTIEEVSQSENLSK